MDNERKLTIISHKKGLFDFAPQCNIMLDGVYIGKLLTGETFNLQLDNKPHSVRCEFKYGKNNEKTESSNTISLEHGLDYVLILKPFANTYKKQVKEDFHHMFSKGYIGIRKINSVEEERQATINKSIIAKRHTQNKRKEDANVLLWDEMSKY